MKKNKGFTLIELMGVIIIMGMLLVIVFPATAKLINSNTDKKFNQYYDLINDAASLYSKSRYDDLGGVNANGCIDDITLTDLITEDYIKKFDDEDITCGSPSEFDLSQYEKIDSNKQYVDVRIRNTKGKISTEVSLICVKKNKIAYSNLIEKSGSCDRYVAEAKNILFDEISKLTSSSDDGENYFLTESSPNNYVLYSGKLFRIVSFNKSSKTIKLISNEIVTLLPYSSSSANYNDSNIDIWLNQEFLSTLRNHDMYLLNADWNYTTVTNASMPQNTDVVKSKVGLLSYYEYNKSKNYLTTNYNWWLLSKASDNSVWYARKSSTDAANISVNNFLGVRPSIVLKPNVTYISGGNGTINNPYKLEGDTAANPGALLNTRYSGEYVMFAGAKYRIVKTNTEYTRLIAESVLSSVTTTFDDINVSTYNSGSKIGKMLNEEWYNNLSNNDKSKLTSSDFCTTAFTSTTKYTISCNNSDVVNIRVGIPKIGDMYTLPSASGEYWTLSNSGADTINTVSSNGEVIGRKINYVSGIRPVINLSNNVQIASGNGTSSNPYTIKE